MGLKNINVSHLAPSDFIYHASSEGMIFGYQHPDYIDEYGSYYDEDRYLSVIDVNHGNVLSDIGSGFYLGNDLEMSYMWGARNYRCSPVLNVFDLSNIDSYGGRVLDVFNDFYDLMAWVVVTSEGRDFGDEDQVNFDALKIQYEENFDQHPYIIAPRSDDRLWSYTQSYLKEELTTAGLLDCTDQLSAGYQLVIKDANLAQQLEFVRYELYSVGNYPEEYHRFNTNAMYQFTDVTGNAIYSVYLYPEEHNVLNAINGEIY